MENTAIKLAAEVMGSQKLLAATLGVSPVVVTHWMQGIRPIPVQRCVQIEAGTFQKVMRWDLRPTDWHLIWPELLSHPDCPAVPTVTTESAHE